MNHRRSHRIYGGPAGRRAGSVPTDRHAVLYRLDHNGVTLDDVAGSANAKLIRDARVEQVALAIYEIAYRTGEYVMRRMVDRELEAAAESSAGV